MVHSPELHLFRRKELSAMKLGMNMLLWGSHVTKDHFPIFAKIKAAGFDGVELPIFEGEPDHYATIGKELERQGLKSTVVTCLGAEANPISGDAAIRKAGLDRRPGWRVACWPLPFRLGQLFWQRTHRRRIQTRR